MIVIIAQLPPNSSAYELHDFVRPVLKGNLFRRTVPVQKLEIIKIHDIRYSTDEYHALVHIDSQPAGDRLIKNLDGKMFKGSKVSVRRYFPYRRPESDRRSEADVHVKHLPEKRQGDRRRSDELLVFDVCSCLYRTRVYT